MSEIPKNHSDPGKIKWRKNFPLIIAVLAFILSLTTSVISIYTSYRKDVHDQLSELAIHLRTIHELSFKLAEIRGTADEAQKGALIGNQIYNSTMVAADLANQVGTNATTAVLLPISERLYNYGDYSRAEQLAELAFRVSRTAEDDAGASRWLGFMKLRSGSEETIREGEKLFLRAANIEKEYDLARVSRKIPWLKALAQLRWADALATVNCEEARKHFLEGVNFLNLGDDSQTLNSLRVSARRTATRGIGGVNLCMPSPETPPIR